MNCHSLVHVTTLPTCVCPVTRTVACQAPLSMGFPRQESWSGLPFLPPGDLPDPGIQPEPPALAYYLPPSHRRSPSANILHDFSSTMTVPLAHSGPKGELKMQAWASTQDRGRKRSSPFRIPSSIIKTCHSVLGAAPHCLPACGIAHKRPVLTNSGRIALPHTEFLLHRDKRTPASGSPGTTPAALLKGSGFKSPPTQGTVGSSPRLGCGWVPVPSKSVVSWA